MNFKIPDNVYRVLKWVALIALPAIGTLWWGLANIWNFPYAEQVLGTIEAVTLFIGSIIGVSTVNYYSNKNDDN